MKGSSLTGKLQSIEFESRIQSYSVMIYENRLVIDFDI